MHLKTQYRKDSTGNVRATVTVIDKEDYLTDQIFNNPDDWPTLPTFELKESICNYISKPHTTPKGAELWANEVILVLGHRLKTWRDAKIPDEGLYVI